MSFDFETTTHGKWILAGEHAVLRGNPALVFPLERYTLKLTYEASPALLHFTHEGLQNEHMDKLIWRVIEEGVTLLNTTHEQLTGHLHINNQVPLGVGLGASAALCVAIARWFNQYQHGALHTFDFARKLEHVFHGQSSGLDIAGAAASNEGVYFKDGVSSPIATQWKPLWFLSSSGEIGITSRCIRQVQTLWHEDESRAKAIDECMANSVHQALSALTQQSIPLLAEAINQACECFTQWGLITPSLEEHITRLREAGAIAVKPTGSGGGGHIISLWKSPPPANLANYLIPI
jgi:mevalonate kinase